MSVLSTIKNIGLYLWLVKSLFLVPWDIYTDVKLAITHFGNGHIMWGSLTSACLLPSLIFPYHYYMQRTENGVPTGVPTRVPTEAGDLQGGCK